MNQLNPARSMELIKTTNSFGWTIAMELAEASVKEAEDAVWNCKDRDSRNDLVLKAQAAREFLADYKQRIESAKSLTAEPGKHAFSEVSLD